MTAKPPRSATMLLLDTSMRVLYPSVIVLGLYFLLAGHNRPGGGFVGGLMVGSALALRYVAQGHRAVGSSFRLPAHVILGLGLMIAAVTAFVPVLLGGSIMEHGDKEFDLPLFHHVKITSALPFDFGVDLVVVGLVLMAFAAFGDDRPGTITADPDEDSSGQATGQAPRRADGGGGP